MIPLNSFFWRRAGVTLFFLSAALGMVLSGAFWVAHSWQAQAAEPETRTAQAPEAEAGRPQTGLPEVHMAIGSHVYRIEVASTPQQAQTGLMYRTHLEQGHGMLFTFNPPRPVSFWMKNTKIPLDILFLTQGRLLHVFKDVQPCLADPCPTYGLPDLTDMVVELPAGTAEHDQLVVGDQAQVRSPSLARHTVSRKGK